MIEFEDRFVPEDARQLTALLRNEAKRVVIEDHRPGADRSPLDWVQRLLETHPEMESAVDDAYERLLAEGDPRIVAEILYQTEQRPGAMVSRLPRVLVNARDALSKADDPSHGDGRTLLGSLVATVARLRPQLSTAAVDVLASIDRREDGWPTSFRMAVIAAPERFSGRVDETLAALDDDELSLFLAALLNDGGAATNDVLDEIGKAPIELRSRSGRVIKSFLEQSETDRQHMIASGILERYPEEIRRRVTEPREDRWPAIAARLRVPRDLM